MGGIPANGLGLNAGSMKIDPGPLVEPPAPPPKAVVDRGDDGKSPQEHALKLLEHAVHVSEAGVATLVPSALDHMLAPDAVVGGVAAKIMAALSGVPKAVEDANQDGAMIASLSPLIARLDDAISRLDLIGHRYKVRMREAHLEKIFDLEDAVLARAGKPQLKRADNYYADDPMVAAQSNTVAPTASKLTDEFTEDKEATPDSRAGLLQVVNTLATVVNRALHDGLGEALRTIEEPAPVEEKDLLEVLAEAAAGLILANGEAALGALLGAGLKRASKMLNVEEHIGAA